MYRKLNKEVEIFKFHATLNFQSDFIHTHTPTHTHAHKNKVTTLSFTTILLKSV